MKRYIRIIVSSVLLVGCLLMTSCELGDSIRIEYEDKDTESTDTSLSNKPSGDSLSGNQSSGNNFSSNQSSGSSSSDDQSSGSSSSDDQSSGGNFSNVIHFNDPDVYIIATDNGKIAKLGCNVFNLKSNTKYRFTLNIDSDKVASSPLNFILYYTSVGYANPAIYYNFDYDNNVGVFHPILLSDLMVDKDCVFELQTPSNYSLPLSFYFFEMNYETTEGVIAAKQYVIDCVRTFDIEEIIEN